MKGRRVWSVARAACVAVVFCSMDRPAAAAPIDCWQGQPLSLADLIATGSDGCITRQTVFSNFSYSITGTGGVIEIPADEVWVDVPSTRYAFGLTFHGPWTIGPDQSVAVDISYDFAGTRLRTLGDGLGVVEPWFDGVAATLTTTVCLGDVFPCDGGTQTTVPRDAGIELGPQHGSVRASLWFDGTLLQSEEPATLDSISTVFRVPEPPLPLLCIAGWTVLAAWRRRVTRQE